MNVLLTAYLIAGLLLAIALCGAGIYGAVIGRSTYGSENKINILGLFSISSSGGALGFVFSGIALFVVCLVFLVRFALR